VTNTFDDYLSYYGCSTLSLVLLCNVSIIVSLNLIVLVKSSTVVFSLRREKCFPRGHVLEGHSWDDAP
jgi:hypothetical protein